MAYTIPAIELGLGLLSIAALWSILINGAIMVMMSGFTVVTLFAMRRATGVACRCFGALSDVQFNQIGLLRSAVLTVVALLVFVVSLLSPNSKQPTTSFITGGALVVAYAVLAIAVAKAAQVVAEIRERMAK